MTGFARHFRACNRHDLTRFAPFFIGSVRYGWVEKNLAASLVHEVEGFAPHADGLTLSSDPGDFTGRSAILARASIWLVNRTGRKLRDEMYPIFQNWGDEPLAQIDRSAVPFFGVRGFGIHVNGFVRKPDGIYLWIAERATDRLVDPGKLDNLIGGGQPIGLSLEQNLAKEAWEEAGIAAELAAKAKPVQTLRYALERPEGLRNDTLFIYDLELPIDFAPRNTDGEVAAFHLMKPNEAASIIRTSERFKFNCNLVVTDFLLRHGMIGKDDPEYAELTALTA